MWIEIDGVRNARDFGGMTGSLGTVRRDRLLRTASFAFATDATRQILQERGVRVIVDLRRRLERDEHPNQLAGLPLEIIASDLSERAGEDLAPHLQFIRDTDLTTASSHAWMVNSYRRFPFFPQHRETFRLAFERLAAGATPLVVHCAAGKDRTGILCGLILHALGLDYAQIEADYLQTNHQPQIDQLIADYADMLGARFGKPIAPDAIAPMVCVDADFLAAAWDEMRIQHGSIEDYLADIGVTADMVAAMRAHLIEA